MKMTFAIIGLVILLAVGGAMYDQYAGPQLVHEAPQKDVSTKDAQSAPDFTVTAIDGKIIRLSDFRGKTVLLNFWATWCAPCVTEFPALVDLIHRSKGRVVLLALSSDANADIIKNFVARQPADVRAKIKDAEIYIALDDDRKITRDIFLTTRYPETIVIDPSGRMVNKIVGEFNWTSLDGDVVEKLASPTGFEPVSHP